MDRDVRPPPRRQGVVQGDPRLPVRRQALPRRGPGIGTVGPTGVGAPLRPDDGSRITPLVVAIVVIALIAAAGAFVFGALMGPDRSPARSPVAAIGSTRPSGSAEGSSAAVAPSTSGAPVGSTEPTGPTGPEGSGPPGSGSPDPSGSPVPSSGPQAMPIVPVVGFWSTDRSISMDQLKAALQGESDAFPVVVVSEADRDAIAQALGIQLAANVESGDAETVRAAFERSGLGLLRATDVTPAMRALAIDDVNLYGNQAVSASEWPLTITATVVGGEGWGDAPVWTIAAGGDILLDRGVARQVTVLDKGVDFPFDGGTAEITGYTCCSGFGWRVPTYRRTGNEGAVRAFLTDADLAMANLEVSIDDQFVYHTEGLRFSADPRLLDGVKNAGIDFLSIANNHIGDSGNDGFTEVREELGARGIAFSGAGANEAEAREFAVLMTNGIRVAVIGCDAIAKYYWADSSSPGSASCKGDAVSTQIRSAREVADVVIVYPHWGTEYTSNPNTGQRNRARQWIEAGADMIIGNHAHWTAAMEEIDGKLAFYALGNFVFDQMWQEQTMEGMLLELTFHGTELVQAWLHPTLVIDSAQPNFMDPEGDGRIVLDRVRDASRGLLSY